MKKRFYINGLEDEELEQFKQLAKQRTGTSLGVFVRQLLKKELEQSQPEKENPTPFSGSLNDETTVDETHNRRGLYVRLSHTEQEFFTQLAKQSGMTINALIALILRAYREQNPKFFNNEIAELQNSNYQMLAIGRNINQIAKQLNSMGLEASLSTTQIAAIDRAIKEHCGVVGNLIKANRKRHSYHI
ncbi:MAG: plasmid mobilization relaxosome protein MobC [Neisseriaceae bacterium]|nr:plasmid mobilization relaxosome protein MobC [Neisseriaceae bacterium]